jgi:hypothetical protein
VIFVLIALAFVGYEHRIHRAKVEPISVIEAKPSASPVETTEEL